MKQAGHDRSEQDKYHEIVVGAFDREQDGGRTQDHPIPQHLAGLAGAQSCGHRSEKRHDQRQAEPKIIGARET